MAAPNQAHEAMLRRHNWALVKFTSASKVAPDKLAFVIADARSRMGMAMKHAAIITTERASMVLPITVDAVPALLASTGCDDVKQLVAEHGAVPVLVIDQDNVAMVSFCQIRDPSGPKVETSVTTSGSPAERSR